MNSTPLGRILGLVVLLLFAIGFVVGSVAPALAGLALLAFIDAARKQTRIGHVEARRHAPPVAGVGKPFTVRVDVSSDTQAPLSVDDVDPLGATGRASTGGRGRGTAVLERVVVADSPGRVEWEHVDVTGHDPWGFWAVTTRVAAAGQTRIAASGIHLEAGRRHGRRHTVQSAVPDPLASDVLPEVRAMRAYMPTDRSRDIDWRLSMRSGALVVRDRERAAPRRFVILLDATRSMRRVALVPKLRSAVHVATGVAGAAQGAGVSSSLVAFHEQGVHLVGDATTRAALQKIVHALSMLPAPVEGFRLTTDLDRAVTAHERRFLQLVAPLAATRRPSAPSLDQALSAMAKVTSGSAFVVAIMDGEVNPRRAEVAVGRLQRMGHSVVLVVPATGPHHFTKQDAPLAELQEAMRRREALGHIMARHKVPMFVLRPGQEDDVVKEVARCAV